jgi:hypothetical protein
MRAVLQRHRRRDLLDLYWTLTKSPNPINPSAVIESFQHYLKQEGPGAGRAEFIGIFYAHLKDGGFCSDTGSLLRYEIRYDAQSAGNYVIANLLSRLPA